jgi:hypothetical protein
MCGRRTTLFFCRWITSFPKTICWKCYSRPMMVNF